MDALVSGRLFRNPRAWCAGVAILAAAQPILARAAGGQRVAVDTTVERLGDYVERYYTRAQSLIVDELVSVQPLARDLSAEGFARRLAYELRVEWTPESADGEPAKVTRHLVAVNGRPPRPNHEPECLDPKSVTPEPLAFLLPDRRHKFVFAAAGLGRIEGRRATMLDYRSRAPEPPKVTWTEDCGSIELPGRSRGRIWADPETAEILRVDEGLTGMVDIRIPPSKQRIGTPLYWTIERADSSVRYRRVAFTDPDETLVLPVTIETVTIVRDSGSPRTRISQTFSNYRRFVTASRIVQ